MMGLGREKVTSATTVVRSELETKVYHNYGDKLPYPLRLLYAHTVEFLSVYQLLALLLMI